VLYLGVLLTIHPHLHEAMVVWLVFWST